MTREELTEILEDHKKWLADNGGERAHLSGAELTGTDLTGANLRETDLRGADLRWANIRETDLRGAELSEANLRGAYLHKADLRGVNLHKADLRGANLRWADIDFSCWPLWCGSLDVKVDARIARQLAYHFCRLDCDDPEYLEARKAMTTLANKFHRVEECGLIKEKE